MIIRASATWASLGEIVMKSSGTAPKILAIQMWLASGTAKQLPAVHVLLASPAMEKPVKVVYNNLCLTLIFHAAVFMRNVNLVPRVITPFGQGLAAWRGSGGLERFHRRNPSAKRRPFVKKNL